ncbi:hypothetical protein NGB28_11575 [Staphylococcus xylosus]|uniref:hypothetical protein n=1 Tax=Staphylococcus xylosus TaxID=1288 RepID=UPI002DBBABC5|nr:hypothetical protein [Staphylococcus xylosus]MEB7660793.1 hypothetical protein [Staphylococcus xylosus]MEB7710780.1 hypothetical protein [Staphylococcus xylosus]MEB7786308.1 hypothetical protein [Staphylococcus xylosus]
MFLDKTETFVLNIGGLNNRATRKNLTKLCKQIQFCNSFKFTIFKQNNLYALEINLPKQQLPYMISFLSFHNYSIYQILQDTDTNDLLDLDHLLLSSRRFELVVDGLRDAFIKDKVIDILNLINQTEYITYTFNRNKINVSTSPSVFAKLIYIMATHNIDILGAVYQPRWMNKARIS